MNIFSLRQHFRLHKVLVPEIGILKSYALVRVRNIVRLVQPYQIVVVKRELNFTKGQEF